MAMGPQYGISSVLRQWSLQCPGGLSGNYKRWWPTYRFWTTFADLRVGCQGCAGLTGISAFQGSGHQSSFSISSFPWPALPFLLHLDDGLTQHTVHNQYLLVSGLSHSPYGHPALLYSFCSPCSCCSSCSINNFTYSTNKSCVQHLTFFSVLRSPPVLNIRS